MDNKLTGHMSVAFIFKEPPRAPTNLREYHVSVELKRRGHTVIWFYLFPYSDNHASELVHDFQEIFLPPRVGPEKTFGISAFHLPKTLKKHNIDILWLFGWHERCPKYLLKLLFCLKLFGLKIVYDPIDPIIEYELSYAGQISWLQRQLVRYSYFLCDLIFVVTSQFKSALISSGVSENKLRVAMCGTDIDKFAICRNPLPNNYKAENETGSKYLIGWLGSMSPFKGIEEILIPLMENLWEKRKDVVFLLAGKGALMAMLEEFRSKRPDIPIRLTGALPYTMAPEFTASLDCYIVPTNPHTAMGNSIIPIKIFDGLAMGIPVITTANDALSEIAPHFNALILSSWDVNSFVDKICFIMDNYASIKESALADAAKVKNYSHQAISKSIVSAMEDFFISLT